VVVLTAALSLGPTPPQALHKKMKSDLQRNEREQQRGTHEEYKDMKRICQIDMKAREQQNYCIA
jgi:hypothetical protein